MKTVLFLLVALLLSSFVAPDPVTFKLNFVTIMLIITGIWEVIGRAIPSVGQITVIGKIIEILNWLSNFLNNKKN
jgi:hypothetical protein